MRFYLAAILLGIGSLLTATNSARAQSETVYKFGVVPQFEPRKLASTWLPILQELAKRTGRQFQMVGSPEIPHFETAFLNGEFDFAYVNPYHAVLAAQKFGAVPLVRDGSRSLFGIVVVRKDSAIQTVKELGGKKVAFPAPNALGASLVIRAELKSLYEVQVNPIYVNTHSSVYLNVILGRADAGGGVMSTLKRQKPNIQDRLRVLYRTRKMNPHPITAHPRVPIPHRQSVQQAFLDMAIDDIAVKLLKKIPMHKAVATSIKDHSELLSWGLDTVDN